VTWGNAAVVARSEALQVLHITPNFTPCQESWGPDLQKFGGTCYTVHRAQVAAVVTTSGFTKQAREYAIATGIALFDNDALAGWAAHNGPPPWFAVPPPLVPVPSPDQEPRGRHSRPTPR
jgi:hypothetical protein